MMTKVEDEFDDGVADDDSDEMNTVVDSEEDADFLIDSL
jgi:hypothetical protein